MSTEYKIPTESEKVDLIKKYADLKNVKIVNSKKDNPYDGKTELELTYDRDEPVGTSTLGTPILTDLTLKGVTYTDVVTGNKVSLTNDQFRNGSQNVRSFSPLLASDQGSGAFYMNLETLLITVTRSIKIIETVIQGRDDEVNEYISAGSHQLSVNGILTGKNGVYPRDAVNRLKRWLDAPVSKPVEAWWLGNLGIDNIVIKDYSLPQTEGGYSYQMFSFTAKSETPIQLYITQPTTI